VRSIDEDVIKMNWKVLVGVGVLVLLSVVGLTVYQTSQKVTAITGNATEEITAGVSQTLNETSKAINETAEAATETLESVAGTIETANQTLNEATKVPEFVEFNVETGVDYIIVRGEVDVPSVFRVIVLNNGRERSDLKIDMTRSNYFERKITGLKPDTEYEVVVDAVAGNGRVGEQKETVRTKKVLKRKIH